MHIGAILLRCLIEWCEVNALVSVLSQTVPDAVFVLDRRAQPAFNGSAEVLL